MLEFIVELIGQFFSQVVVDKFLKPVFRKTGTLWIKFLNLFLKEKVDISRSPNKGAIGCIVWFIIFTGTLVLLIYY
jgi:hypothetical protein